MHPEFQPNLPLPLLWISLNGKGISGILCLFVCGNCLCLCFWKTFALIRPDLIGGVFFFFPQRSVAELFPTGFWSVGIDLIWNNDVAGEWLRIAAFKAVCTPHSLRFCTWPWESEQRGIERRGEHSDWKLALGHARFAAVTNLRSRHFTCADGTACF